MPEPPSGRARAWAEAACRQARRVFARFAAVLGGATGTHAYAGYLAHHARHHGDATPLTREQFFREALEARWHGVRRCC